jgi:hypothetical protein
LWQNDETQQILAKRRPLLRRSSGLWVFAILQILCFLFLFVRPSFMDDLQRIIRPDFAPTDCEERFAFGFPVSQIFYSTADILRARLRTIGIEEQHFKLERRLSHQRCLNSFRWPFSFRRGGICNVKRLLHHRCCWRKEPSKCAIH